MCGDNVTQGKMSCDMCLAPVSIELSSPEKTNSCRSQIRYIKASVSGIHYNFLF